MRNIIRALYGSSLEADSNQIQEAKSAEQVSNETRGIRDTLLRAVSRIIEPFMIYALTRLTLIVIAYLSTLLLPHPKGPWLFGRLFDVWIRWDSGWYLAIARTGYSFNPEDLYSSIAFFPLYPLLIRLFTPIFGDEITAGLFIANFAFACGLVVLYLLTEMRFDRDSARRTTFLMACFPYSFFLNSVYTEALFFCFATLAFFFAERKSWWLAGLAAGFCSATRLVGSTLVPALALLYFEQSRFDLRKMKWDVLSIALMPLGLFAFMAYQFIAFRQPFAMVLSSTSWGRYNPFVQGFERFNLSNFIPGNFDLVLFLNFSFAVLWLVFAILMWRKVGASYALFVALATLIPLSQQTESLGRFMAVLFPVFIYLGQVLKNRVVFSIILYTSTLLLGVIAILFANAYFIV